MGFMYFIPGIVGLTRNAIDEAGLSRVVSGVKARVVQCSIAGVSGVAIANPVTNRGRAKALGFGNDSRVLTVPPDDDWFQREGSPCGVLMACVGEIHPSMVMRGRAQVSGYDLELGDGNVWTIPCARKFPMGTELPQTIVVRNGVLVAEDVAEFAAFSLQAEELFERAYVKATVGEPVTILNAWELAVDAIAINYMLDTAEVSYLKLFRAVPDKENAMPWAHWDDYVPGDLRCVMGAIIDEKRMRDALGFNARPTLSENHDAQAKVE